jgi:hypothetical protein
LALEAALRRREGADQVHLASSHRVLRAQRFVAVDQHSQISGIDLIRQRT